jgi:hypothetical protein
MISPTPRFVIGGDKYPINLDWAFIDKKTLSIKNFCSNDRMGASYDLTIQKAGAVNKYFLYEHIA